MDIRLKIAFIGAAVGFLGAVGIVFEPAEPYKDFIVVAGTLGGIVMALLISVVVDRSSSIAGSLAWGAFLGLLHSSVIFLAKGGWSSMDAPYVVPTGIISGLVLGLAVRRVRSGDRV